MEKQTAYDIKYRRICFNPYKGFNFWIEVSPCFPEYHVSSSLDLFDWLNMSDLIESEKNACNRLSIEITSDCSEFKGTTRGVLV
jgi:hypothetical protein